MGKKVCKRQRFTLKSVLGVRGRGLSPDIKANDEARASMKAWLKTITPEQAEEWAGLERAMDTAWGNDTALRTALAIMADWVEEHGGHREWYSFIYYRRVLA